jgi:hypothetical protein
MIAVDTNILVYAYRRDSRFYMGASRAIQELAEGDGDWAIPWPCIHEFLAVVTSPRVYDPPSPFPDAFDQASAWSESPRMALIGEEDAHLTHLEVAAAAMNATGIRIHDAKIAAICLSHGVRELWTVDRDFANVPGLRTRNPLAGLEHGEGPPSDEGGPSVVN